MNVATTDPFGALAHHRVVPVIALDKVSDAKPLAEALLSGGLPIAEVTFRSAAAVDALRIMAASGELLTIAGTVRTTSHVDAAIDAGARMIVTPGFNPRVVEHAQQRGIPICPGVATPSEIEMALEAGLTTVKFFPAESFGGVKALKAFAGPYPQMRFMPTGGISPANLAEYLQLPSVLCCGGSWMVAPALYAGGDFAPVVQAVREVKQLI
jgi:2-dehydro-3-deoxyphosphogluconate aldolase / (4S)-4-hydroxy-2-oxoglutarate aldolase